MSDQAAAGGDNGDATVAINVKAPSDVKLSLKVKLSSTVLELKQQIANEKPSEYSADALRLIWSGRVLKDDDTLGKYGLKDGNTIHLVKGNRANAATSSSGPTTSSAAAGVPTNVAAGQQFMGNPLAPLMNAQNAGALGGFNPFAEMGINPNDPNYMQSMMRDPAVQQQVNSLLQNPAVLDQIIQSNPQLSAMGPGVRQIMQSEQFRQFFTNPDAMQQMMQMMGGGAGGASPFGGFGGGAGGMPAPGGTAQGQGQQRTGAGLYNPWASAPSTTGAGTGESESNNNNAAAATGTATGTASATTGAGAAEAGAFNPFAAMGGDAGGVPDIQTMMQQLQQLQQLQQMFGSGTGQQGMFGGSPASGGAQQQQRSQVPPEERYQSQLETLAGMGFHDASRNLRALMASGGNVEAAIEYLFSMP
ncbi:hypothetical protein ACM66B_001612 [Microbotryomycetes sp. NB124-2]